MTFETVLAPLTWLEFRDRYLGQQYWLSKGHPERLRGLLTWAQLNETLTHLRVSGKRVRLVKDGKDLHPAAFQVMHDQEEGSLLHARECVRHLNDGATLVVNKVDELFDPVRALAESCEQALRQYIGVNLYAGWRTTKGFDQHWDQHDTLILQIDGVKHWTVWAPTRLHPLRDDVVEAPRPTDPPVWDGLLEPGDVLYMPRGWWHVAMPLDQPCLHLTAGFSHRTGVDLLIDLLRGCKAHAAVRQDIPHWAPREAQMAWLAEMRTLLADALADALADDAIDRFMARKDDEARSRPGWFLPDDVRSAPPALTAEARIRLRRGSRIQIIGSETDTPTTISVSGAEWKVSPALLPALRTLHNNQPATLQGMEQLIEPMLRPVLRAVMTGLLLSEAVWIEPPVLSPPADERERLAKDQLAASGL